MTRGTRPLWVRLVAVGLVAVALASCSDEGEPITLPSPTAQTPASSPSLRPATSPTPEDPFAVPDEITADYVERVLNEIHRLDAELVKDLLQRPLDSDVTELPASDRATLDSLYEEPLRTTFMRASLDLLRSEEERGDLRPPEEMTQFRTSIEEVLETRPCIIARGRTDTTGVDAEVQRDEPLLSFYFLVREDTQNSTGWLLARQLEGTSGGDPVPEEELRALTSTDLVEQLPEVCK